MITTSIRNTRSAEAKNCCIALRHVHSQLECHFGIINGHLLSLLGRFSGNPTALSTLDFSQAGILPNFSLLLSSSIGTYSKLLQSGVPLNEIESGFAVSPQGVHSRSSPKYFPLIGFFQASPLRPICTKRAHRVGLSKQETYPTQ
jgi:hypothetical protein